MTIFEHLGTLMSFILSLAIATLVVFLARLVRRRKAVVWSVPHGLWMAIILLNAVLFWINSYQLRSVQTTSALTVVAMLVLTIGCFLQAELVAPGDAGPDDFDLRAFHARHKGEYIGATMFYGVVLAAYVEWIAFVNHGPTPIAMLTTTAATLVLSASAIWLKPGWVQVTAPLILLGMRLAYLPMATAAMSQT